MEEVKQHITTDKLVPLLRFKEFEDEWEHCKLGDGINLISGQHLSPEEYNSNGLGIPYFTGPSDFTENENELTKWTEYSNHFGNYNDILFTVKGSGVGTMTLLKLKQVAMGRQLMAIKTESFDATFIYNSLLKKVNLLVALASGNMIPGLSRKDILTLKIKVPTIYEQQKIASFLSSVDTKLQQLRQKKELLEQYKKGVMQQLFSQQLRFKQPDGSDYTDWEEKKLGEIGETFNGLTGKTKEDFGDGKPYVQYMQIFEDSKINLAQCGFVSMRQDENQNRVYHGDVFFTTSSETPLEIGTSSVLLDDIEELYLNSFCFGYRPKSHLIPEFARYLFRSSYFRRKIIPLAQGSTRYNMSKKELLKLKVDLPSEEEQQQIANYLNGLDTKIESVNQQITQTQQFKKGLLQQMFV